MTTEITKRISYNKDTRDFDVFITIDEVEDYIGSASTYGQAEVKANQYAICYYEDNHTPEKAAELVMANDFSCYSIPAHIAHKTYPIFGRFCIQAEALNASPEVLALAATMADDLIAALA